MAGECDRCVVLEVENDALRAEISDLRDLLGGRWYPPLEYQLTQTEAAILGALVAVERCSKEHMWQALYMNRSTSEMPEIKIIDVLVCKLRRKVRPFGVEIDTLYGYGYRLLPDTRAALAAYEDGPAPVITARATGGTNA